MTHLLFSLSYVSSPLPSPPKPQRSCTTTVRCTCSDELESRIPREVTETVSNQKVTCPWFVHFLSFVCSFSPSSTRGGKKRYTVLSFELSDELQLSSAVGIEDCRTVLFSPWVVSPIKASQQNGQLIQVHAARRWRRCWCRRRCCCSCCCRSSFGGGARASGSHVWLGRGRLGQRGERSGGTRCCATWS